MKPHVIYTRVSTEDQAREGASLDAQREACAMLSKLRGFPTPEPIEDAGFSAKSLKRPGIARIISAIKAGEIKAVIVWRLDRLTRSLRDLLDMVDLFDQHGVALVSVMEQLDTTTPMGRLMLALLGAVAQWERESIAERVKLGVNHRKSQGFWTGGHVPAGCQVIGTTGQRKLVADPIHAPTARQAWRRIIDGGSLAQVAEWLELAKVPASPVGNTRNQRWNKQNLQRWLTNEIVIGVLIDRSVFELCKKTLGERSSPQRRAGNAINCTTKAERVWPLKGIARCALCGAMLAGSTAYGRDGSARYYLRCTNRLKAKGCKAPDLAAEPWEKATIDVLMRSVHGNGDLMTQLEKLGREQRALEAPAREHKTALIKERDAVQKNIDKLVEYILGGDAASKAVKPKLAELQTTVDQFDQQIAACDGEISAAAMAATSAEYVLSQFKERLTKLDHEPVALQHHVLSTILSEIHLAQNQPMRMVFWWPLRMPGDPDNGGPGPRDGSSQPKGPQTGPTIRLPAQTPKKETTTVGSHSGHAWRTGGDSNPRTNFSVARFPSVCLQPLSHLSKVFFVAGRHYHGVGAGVKKGSGGAMVTGGR
jgi:site-specific DNA recombinase